MIAKRHGTFQKWVDKKVDEEIALIKGLKGQQAAPPAKLTAKEKAKVKKMIDEMF